MKKITPYNTGKLRIGEMYDYPIRPPVMRPEEYQLQSVIMGWDKGGETRAPCLASVCCHRVDGDCFFNQGVKQ
jgi:hypothetical protein